MRVTSVGAAVDAATVMSARRAGIVQGWLDLPLFTTVFAGQRADAEAAAGTLLDALIEVTRSGRTDDFRAPTFKMISDVLSRVTSSRLRSGGDLSQIVAEIGELREPVKAVFDEAPDAAMVPSALVTASEVVGALRVAAVVALLNESDDAVARQRKELLETTTPVIRLWEGIVAVPLIGTLDSNRSQVVMESLLNGIVEEQAEIAILDITGVPMVDTLVAQHLMKTAMAVRLMGAECVISGIGPQIAQTIVALGIDLGSITTRATLSDALKYGLEQTGVRLGTGG